MPQKLEFEPLPPPKKKKIEKKNKSTGNTFVKNVTLGPKRAVKRYGQMQLQQISYSVFLLGPTNKQIQENSISDSHDFIKLRISPEYFNERIPTI